jgi:hypothetical protein
LVVAALCVGCGSETQPPAPANPRMPAAQPAADLQADFVGAFRRASEQKDVEGILNLYCWESVPGDLKQTIRENVESEVRATLADVTVIAAEPGEYGPRQEGAVRWKPNLPVVAVLKAKFAPGSPGVLSISDASYLLGQKNGRYQMVVYVPDR